MTRTALYRHFDAEECLLYVGVTKNPKTRQWEHSSRAGWFGDIARIDVQWFPDRTSALDAERTAIVSEKPKHNQTLSSWDNPAGKLVLAIGEKRLKADLGLGRTSIHNAVMAGQFPASWYVVVDELARETGVPCPPIAFNFKGNPKIKSPKRSAPLTEAAE